MNLREEIEREHSRATVDRIVQWVGSDQSRFTGLFKIFLGNDKLLAQRASWPMSYCVQAHPALIEPHYEALLANLQREKLHAAIKRNSLRLLQYVTMPENYSGIVMDRCFQYIESPSEAVAIKAFALTVLHNLSRTYPEILGEIKLLIETRWEYETAAFKSRARRVMKG